MGNFVFTGRHAWLLEEGFLETKWLMEEISDLKEKSCKDLLVSMRGLLRGHKKLMNLGKPRNALKHANFSRADVEHLVSNQDAFLVLLDCLRGVDYMVDGCVSFEQQQFSSMDENIIKDLFEKSKKSRENYTVNQSTESKTIRWNRHKCVLLPVPPLRRNEHEDKYKVRLEKFFTGQNVLTMEFLSFFLEHPYYIPPIGKCETIAFPGTQVEPKNSFYNTKHCFVLNPWSKQVFILPQHDLCRMKACTFVYDTE